MSESVKSMLAQANEIVPRISAAETRSLIDAGGVVVVDVREPAEVDVTGKLPGAINIPRGLIEFRADPDSSLHDARLDRDRTVVLYCASGGRSALAGQVLKRLGFRDVRNMGGFNDWDQENFPVEAADA